MFGLFLLFGCHGYAATNIHLRVLCDHVLPILLGVTHRLSIVGRRRSERRWAGEEESGPPGGEKCRLWMAAGTRWEARWANGSGRVCKRNKGQTQGHDGRANCSHRLLSSEHPACTSDPWLASSTWELGKAATAPSWEGPTVCTHNVVCGGHLPFVWEPGILLHDRHRHLHEHLPVKTLPVYKGWITST